jgi:hypothetical protein
MPKKRNKLKHLEKEHRRKQEPGGATAGRKVRSPLGQHVKEHVMAASSAHARIEGTLAERIKAHVDEQVARDPEMRDLTPAEAWAEVSGTEDENYDLREACLKIDRWLSMAAAGRYEMGDYLIANYWPPLQYSRNGYIYFNEKPKARYNDLLKFSGLPCSRSELHDCVQLALQKRSLDAQCQEPGLTDHMSLSQLILLTRVKNIHSKTAVIAELKKYPKKYAETKQWMREQGYLKAAKKPVDATKKLIEGFERVVKSAEGQIPALDAAAPHTFGFNVLTGWRERMATVVELLAALEAEEKGEKAA